MDAPFRSLETHKRPRRASQLHLPGTENAPYGGTREHEWVHGGDLQQRLIELDYDDEIVAEGSAAQVFDVLNVVTGNGGASGGQKRALSPEIVEAEESSAWFAVNFPELSPMIPRCEQRHVDIEAPNPFSDHDGVAKHPRSLRVSVTPVLSTDGSVDGLIKIRFRKEQEVRDKRAFASPFRRVGHEMRREPLAAREFLPPPIRHGGDGESNFPTAVSKLPKDFGRGLRLGSQDARLWTFFIVGICSGRTLIDSENTYIREIAPIATRNECVKHALLALASTYLLDYEPNKRLEARANLHHKRAVQLLGTSLNDQETWEPGKEDAILAAISLLMHNENVNWELSRAAEQLPVWYRGSLMAETILAASDPGYRYQAPSNVQCNRARLQLGNKVGLYNIMSAAVSPFSGVEQSCPFSWLLHGSEREMRKIVGLTGLSPKLMHTYAQITHLTARFLKDPTSIIVPLVGKAIEERLHDFWQWSDLSEGYTSSQELMESCELDANGKITSAVKAVELTAETYVAAAQIYLHCRLLRRSRTHPLVQNILQRLLQCIAWMPSSGPLFTAQAPLFTVFIAGMVAVEQADREVVKAWFIPVIRGARGNVPPAWRATQALWQWLDADAIITNAEAAQDHDAPTKDSLAWWELAVEELSRKEGRLNLA